MKRSKLFLGITSGLLAVVGIAAAKSHSVTTNNPWYYTSEATPINCAQDLSDSFQYQTIQSGQSQLIAPVSGVGVRHLYVTSQCVLQAAVEK